jgi:hypothetical protein
MTAVLFCAVGTASAFSQATSGDLVGTVKDTSGAVVPGAKITVTSESTGVTTSVPAGTSGEFRVSNLLPAQYDIKVQAPGFQPYDLKGLTVDLNVTATANVTLSIGASQTVEVIADAGAVLDTTSTNLSQTFSDRELSALPTASVGFGVLNAALLSPGVASSGGIGIGEGPSVGGQRPRNNNFTIEGIDNNDKSVTGPLVYIPNDSVGSFTLITNQFSPEFGHSSGGQFNVAVASGSNHFHGKLWEFVENRDLDAGSGTAGTKPALRPRYDFNRYGGQLGGPIFRDKLFFFGSFERQTTGQNLNSVLCSPTSAGLTALSSVASNYGFSATNLAQYLKYTPTANVTGPNSTGIDANDDAACGNQSAGPQYLTVTNAASTASTNIALGNYVSNPANYTNFDALTTGVDYSISSRDNIRVRYLYNTSGSIDASPALPIFYGVTPNRYHLASISEFHTFTANLTNEFRLGFNRYANNVPIGNFVFPGLDQFPNLVFGDQGQLQYGPDPNGPQSTIQNLYQATNNVSYVKGKHTIKIGFDGRKYISPQNFTQRSRGDYEYSVLNLYLQDIAPDSVGERSTGNTVYYGDQTALYGYGNDTWRVTPTVTLNIGLRYEFTSVPYSERLQSLNILASIPGVISFSTPKPQYKNFAPRFGINWAPDSKTSVRAGFGVAYDVLFDNLGILSKPPQYGSTNDVGVGSAPAANSPNFLKNGGLPAGSGSGLSTFSTVSAQQAATSGYVPNQILPYAESYTLTVQRTIGSAYTAEIGYVGTRGIHLATQIQQNVQSPVTATNQLTTSLTGPTVVPTSTTANTLSQLTALPYIIPAYTANGNNLSSKITAYQPYSQSNYNGLVANLQRRFQQGLQMNLSYTWSKTMDDATAEVFSTSLTPRRQQNSQCISCDYSRSALDRTHRITLEAVYDLPFFKNSHNFLLKNLVGNWEVAPIYTYESPEYATVLSGAVTTPKGLSGLFVSSQANLNRDSSTYIGRTIINPNGVPGTGSAVTPQFSSTLAGNCPTGVTECRANLVGYVAVNPNAYYIQAGQGTLPNSSRNTMPTRPTDNFDLSAAKRLTFFDHYNFEFGAQAFNVLNHAEYTPGSVDTIGASGDVTVNYQTVTSSFFNKPQLAFGNNARVLQLSGKFVF